MGCGPSSLEAAHLSNALADPLSCGADRLLDKLRESPWLLSTAASVLCSSHSTPLHAACEGKQVKAVQTMVTFLATSTLSVVREALKPHCRRVHVPPPTSVAEGLRMAVDMTNSKGQTPMMLACSAGSPELVKLLLAQGADPWVADHTGGRTALHYAAMAGHADCIEMLMQNLQMHQATRQGVSYVNVRTLCGLSALHYAVFFDHTAAVEELLGHDPNLNASTTAEAPDFPPACVSLSTPLHFVAIRDNLAIAKQLLRHFALCPLVRAARPHDLRHCRNEEGQLPWQVAAMHHPTHRELIALLHPGQSLERALGLGPGMPQDGGELASNLRRGPQPLANIAAAALLAKLLADLRGIRTAAAAAAAAAAAKATKSGTPTVPYQSTTSAARTLAAAALRRSLKLEPGEPLSLRASRASLAGARSLLGLSTDEDDEGLCGVCLERMEEVAAAGCGHAVCGQCAEEMCRSGLTPGGAASVQQPGGRPRPLLCAFCRQEVSGFVAAPAAPPAKVPPSPAAAAAALAAARAVASKSYDKHPTGLLKMSSSGSGPLRDLARAVPPLPPLRTSGHTLGQVSGHTLNPVSGQQQQQQHLAALACPAPAAVHQRESVPAPLAPSGHDRPDRPPSTSTRISAPDPAPAAAAPAAAAAGASPASASRIPPGLPPASPSPPPQSGSSSHPHPSAPPQPPLQPQLQPQTHPAGHALASPAGARSDRRRREAAAPPPLTSVASAPAVVPQCRASIETPSPPSPRVAQSPKAARGPPGSPGGARKGGASPTRRSVSPSRRSISPGSRIRRKAAAIRQLRDRRKKLTTVTASPQPGPTEGLGAGAKASPRAGAGTAAAAAAAGRSGSKAAGPGGSGLRVSTDRRVTADAMRVVTCIGFGGGGGRVVPVSPSALAPPSPSRPLSAPSPRTRQQQQAAAAAAAAAAVSGALGMVSSPGGPSGKAGPAANKRGGLMGSHDDLTASSAWAPSLQRPGAHPMDPTAGTRGSLQRRE